MKANYLRLSVTDHCNLSCFYCRPSEAVRHLKREEFLSFEEISHLVSLAVDWGIRKVRITGGEPLLRNNIIKLVEMLSGIEGIRDLPITTNGVKLEEFAPLLKEAGVSRVNVSLDSLNKKGFARTTGQDNLGQVLRGIKVAKEVGLEPIKVNVVVLKGINEGEILDFINFALENNLIIRFIEYMPTNGLEQNDWYFSNSRVKEIIERKWGSLEPISFLAGSVARYYKIDDTKVVLGFISPISQPFCHQCNRLRLTAMGKLKPCLASNLEIDVRKPLREKAGDHEIKILFDLAMKEKLKGRPEPPYQRNKYMFQIGG